MLCLPVRSKIRLRDEEKDLSDWLMMRAEGWLRWTSQLKGQFTKTRQRDNRSFQPSVGNVWWLETGRCAAVSLLYFSIICSPVQRKLSSLMACMKLGDLFPFILQKNVIWTFLAALCDNLDLFLQHLIALVNDLLCFLTLDINHLYLLKQWVVLPIKTYIINI